MPERWPRLRCPDCGETEFTDKEWSDRAHVCPLYMEPTWRGLVQRNDGRVSPDSDQTDALTDGEA